MVELPHLQVNLKKISAERSSFHCRRPDGTDVWSRVHPFYPGHDLSHFAVETALGLRQGFYGLIATGWELADFVQKRVAEKLPLEAFWTECAVGVTELLNRPIPLPLAEWQDALDQSVASQKLPPFRRVNEAEYARLNTLRADLLRQWVALPMGETLTLGFAMPASG
jgi:hypothetical protein